MITEPVYRLRQVCRVLGTTFSLTIDDWEHARGETLCIVGPTGAGKTTFLRMLTGLTSIQGGSIEFDGHEWPNGLASLSDVRQIAMVPQRPILLSRSVRANLEYGLRLRGITSEDRVSELLHCLGLAKLASKSAQTLSGGQVQLVALGRALVLQPKILLLDEPTANLDPGYVALVEHVLDEWRERYQTTLIWATHNMFQAQRVGDRVGLLLDGRIVEVALREEFFHRPIDPRTRDFVQGKMVY